MRDDGSQSCIDLICTEQPFYLLKYVFCHHWTLTLSTTSDTVHIVFTDVFLDIMAKYISSKIITCSEKYAPWITSEVKTAIKRNHRVYRNGSIEEGMLAILANFERVALP